MQISTSPRHRRTWSLALLGAALVALTAVEARAVQKIAVLTNRNAGEFQPARGGDFLAWEQNTKARPNWYNVYARRDGGKKFRVNAPGTQAAMGGIAGNRLVYQQFSGSNSDIKFFNLATRKRRSPQVYINTRKWEYWPSISGEWVLFGRRNARATKRKVILFNTSTLAVRIIDQTTNAKSFISPGQVNGKFVVWHRCRPVPNCDVYRYNIENRLTAKIPNPSGISQHAASVTSDGTVYFARGGKKCGLNVRLMRFPLGGPATKLADLADGRDAGDSFSMTDANDVNHFFYELNRCGRPAGSDIYKVLD